MGQVHNLECELDFVTSIVISFVYRRQANVPPTLHLLLQLIFDVFRFIF